MQDLILCPNCKQSIPLSEALSHEIKDKYRKLALEYKQKAESEFNKKLDEEKVRLEKTVADSVRKKIEQELSLKLEDQKNEAEELKKQNRAQQTQLLELSRSIRELKVLNDQKALELEKKLNEAQEKIRLEEKKRMDEEYRLKMLEYEKKISDVSRANDDLRRKLEQGSQQLQGEVLELELEHILKQEFPQDEIIPVAKGVRGGDILQIVKNVSGKPCGGIMWELKRTKTWSNEWIKKLKDDQRAQKAEAAVIISDIIPADMKNFGWRDGVWVGNFGCIVGLAHAVRRSLLEISLVKFSQDNKSGKMEVLYNYVYGTEFRQRIEAIVEAFTSLQNNIEKEKRWFASKWAKEETDIRRVMDNMFGLQGDIQSITGKELPDGDLDLLSDSVEDRN